MPQNDEERQRDLALISLDYLANVAECQQCKVAEAQARLIVAQMRMNKQIETCRSLGVDAEMIDYYLVSMNRVKSG